MLIKGRLQKELKYMNVYNYYFESVILNDSTCMHQILINIYFTYFYF